MRRWMAGATGAVLAGLLAAACSSGSQAPAAAPGSPAPQASHSPMAAGAVTVSLHGLPGIPGKALVAGSGRALYLFEADKHGKSTCSGACAAAWPPDTISGTPHAGPGVQQALLGTIRRADGTLQVTYHGHPLYFFAADTGAGTAKGEGSKAFGADWYVVSASGNKIDTD